MELVSNCICAKIISAPYYSPTLEGLDAGCISCFYVIIKYADIQSITWSAGWLHCRSNNYWLRSCCLTRYCRQGNMTGMYIQQQNFRCQMHIKGYGSCMCRHHHHNHPHHLFWKHQFFPRYMARWHFTRVNSTNSGPVTIRQACRQAGMDIGASFGLGDRMPFLVSTSWGLGRQAWTLERVLGDRMPFLVSTSWGLGGWNSTSVTCVHDGNWSMAGGIAFPVLCEKGGWLIFVIRAQFLKK